MTHLLLLQELYFKVLIVYVNNFHMKFPHEYVRNKNCDTELFISM